MSKQSNLNHLVFFIILYTKDKIPKDSALRIKVQRRFFVLINVFYHLFASVFQIYKNKMVKY